MAVAASTRMSNAPGLSHLECAQGLFDIGAHGRDADLELMGSIVGAAQQASLGSCLRNMEGEILGFTSGRRGK